MTVNTKTESLGAQFAPSWHRPFLRYIEGDQGSAGEPQDQEQEQEQLEEETPEGAESLGDPGKQALDRMKAQRNAERDRAKAAEAERDALKALIDGKESEHAAEVERQKAKDEALAAANQRILSAELRAAAKGKLADPADAGLFIDLDSFEVGDDGEVDTDALNSAIDDLLARKPHLAATGRRFNGDGDGGARGGDPKLKQVTEVELESMTAEQINEARRDGRLNKLLGRTN